MKRSFADYEDKAKLACFSSKNDKRPEEIGYRSAEKFNFECKKCGFGFSRRIHCVTIGNRWCLCCDIPQKICDKPICSVCFNKSFSYIYPERTLGWSEKNAIAPHTVTKWSTTKFFLVCITCENEYKTSAVLISSGRGCPCCETQRKICERESCQICFKKSIAFHFPERTRDWSRNNAVPPSKVTKCSPSRYLFVCRKCNHEYKSSQRMFEGVPFVQTEYDAPLMTSVQRA